MSEIFSDLVSEVITKLQVLLEGRPEGYARNVTVANRVTSKGKTVTVTLGPSLGTADTLDSATLRVNVRATVETDAADLAFLVRALMEAPAPVGIVDGDPVVSCQINAGPVEVHAETEVFHWYFVANVIRRGRTLR